MTPDDVNQKLKALQALSAEMEAAVATGDMEQVDLISRKLMALSGVDPAKIATSPAIFDAIEDGELSAVITHLKTWDVNATHDTYEKTALYHAVSPSGVDVSFAVIHALLDAGADPRLGLGEQTNVLHGFGFGVFPAETVNDLEGIIRRCVSLGADLEQRTTHLNWTPLHTALGEWNAPVAEALLRAGADPDATVASEAAGCTGGQNCLGMALGQPKLFGLLLAFGADAERVDASGQSIREHIVRHLQESDEGDWKANVATCLSLLDRRERPD